MIDWLGELFVTEQWHVSKTVSVGHILTTVLMVAGGVAALMEFENRMTTIETNQANQAVIHQTYEEHTKEGLTALKQQITTTREELRQDNRDLNNKLDRIMERIK